MSRAHALPGGSPWHRLWERHEDDILRQTYPTGGAKGAGRLLPGRPLLGIYRRAAQLGLRRPGGRGRPRNA